MSTTARPIPANRRVYTETVIHIIQCATCNIDFGIGEDFERRRREDHAGFYCPNGHSNVYDGPSDAEQRARIAERELGWMRSSRDAALDQAKAAEYARRGQKAANTKLRKRIAAGVCPCCKRTFQNLGRHMAGQHPTYTEADS